MFSRVTFSQKWWEATETCIYVSYMLCRRGSAECLSSTNHIYSFIIVDCKINRIKAINDCRHQK